MPQPWPWVKVMERSSSTIPQTHIFFVPNIKGLAQTVLTWEEKVFADADAAETDWKHKVTPERGDLNTHTRMIISYQFEIIPVMVHINIVACECNQNMTKFLRCMEVQCGVSFKSRRCWEVRTSAVLLLTNVISKWLSFWGAWRC